jgi:uncharacterized protein YqjF (DUF2071 family)
MTFNTLHKINKVFYFTTLALYLLVYFGMMFQIILGIVQLIIAFTMLVRRDELSKSKKTKLIIYWVSVITVFLLIVINFKLKYVVGNLFCLFVLPMAIATYFYFFTANINSESFLEAKWQNLALFNYEVDPKLLEKYIPAGTEIDVWNNKCYVSLVGFMFKNTKVIGLKFPFHINFEEVNLRFYVKRFENGEWKRGVVFIKEIVPKKAITLIANNLYKEHYETQKMNHEISENENCNYFMYQWKNEGKWNMIEIETAKDTKAIEVDSEAEFITEHYFGYTKIDKKTTFEYEVQHPRWEQLEVLNHKIDVDFEKTYGTDFTFLQNTKPTSVFLAKGSEITVQNKRKLQIVPVLEETYQSI